MAQQNITIGTANQGNGDTMFDAFTKVEANFTELYSDDAGDVGSITATAPISRDQATGAVTISLNDNGVTHAKLENRYTAVVTKTDTSGTGGSAIDIGWDDGAVFNFSSSLTGDIELKFDAYKVGQVIDIYGLTGSHTVTLNSTASGAEVFNKVGGVDYDGSSSNLIQVVCVDDSASTPVFNYAIATYTSAQP
tara:strand:- start:266 stop:844 length:579 start_codon:yes stop_codon:yes gene_type:complete